MKTKYVFVTALMTFLVACGESEVANEPIDDVQTTEADQTSDEAAIDASDELAAINDKSRKADGAIECLTQQYTLVKQGKFDEALAYYSARVKAKAIAELTANPAVKKDWQAATNLSEQEFQEIIDEVRANPEFFVFEDGMWRMDQK